MAYPLREHTYVGTTQSLCPECLEVIPAKILVRDGRVYFRKHCLAHGVRDDFVCSDARWFDRLEFNLPGRIPPRFAIEPHRGCPYDCGLCSEHEQHTCVAVFEITSSCNLRCPMCYAESGPGGQHLSVDECRRALDFLVAYEGHPEVLQLSGGEPTVHPKFEEIFIEACDRPIDIVMINTNGIRLASDDRLCDLLGRFRERCQVYLQWDGFDEETDRVLRGESLQSTRMEALARLEEIGIRTTLVATIQADLNLNQVGPLVRFGMSRRGVAGISFQPATYVGRWVAPEDLDRRVTFPDLIHALDQDPLVPFAESDFLPLPCAHPNTHALAYAFRHEGEVVPLTRFMDIAPHVDLLANGIAFSKASAKDLIENFLARQACGENCGCGPAPAVVSFPDGEPKSRAPDPTLIDHPLAAIAKRFFERALRHDLTSEDVFRITTTSFMDAYNFDLRQLIQSCVHHLLPSGHLIPFCAYNNLYRNGQIPLPKLRDVPRMSASLPIVTQATR